MKLDSTAPASENPAESSRTVDVSANSYPLTEEQASRERAYHDLRASLAIINGYSLALESTFRELTEKYNVLVATPPDEIDADAASHMMLVEADCRFCLSRLCHSIGQLKIRLQIDKPDSGPDHMSEAE